MPTMSPDTISDFTLFSPVFPSDPLLFSDLHSLTDFDELPKDIFLSNEAEEIAELDTKEALKPLLEAVHDGDGGGEGAYGVGNDDGDEEVKAMEMVEAYESNMSVEVMSTVMDIDKEDEDEDEDQSNIVSPKDSSTFGVSSTLRDTMPITCDNVSLVQGSTNIVHVSASLHLPPLSPRFAPTNPAQNDPRSSSSGVVPTTHHADSDLILSSPSLAFSMLTNALPSPQHCNTDTPLADLNLVNYACGAIASPSPLAGTSYTSLYCTPNIQRSHSSHDLGRLLRASNHKTYDYNWFDTKSVTPYIDGPMSDTMKPTCNLSQCEFSCMIDNSEPKSNVGSIGTRLLSEENRFTWNNILSNKFIPQQGVPLMRRVHSAGDIEVFTHLNEGGNPLDMDNMSPRKTRAEEVVFNAGPKHIGHCTIEERKEKLHRYRQKRNERNFTKKIKYACRKNLADTRHRVRGRFARTDDPEDSPMSCGTNAMRHVTLMEDCRNSTNRHTGPSHLLSEASTFTASTGYSLANNASSRFWMNVAI